MGKAYRIWTRGDWRLVRDHDYWQDIYIPRREEMLDAFVHWKEIYAPRADRLLDLGGGTGAVSLRICRSKPGIEPVILDLSRPLLETARQRFAMNGLPVQLRRVDLDDTGWARSLAGDYPLIVSNLALHHLLDPGKARIFGEIHRLLSPGGVFLYGDLIRFEDPRAEDAAFMAWTRDLRINHICRGLVVQDLETMKRRTVEACNEQGDLPATIGFIVDTLARAGFNHAFLVWFYVKFAVFVALR